MKTRIARAIIVFIAFLVGTAYAQVTFTLIPPSGEVEGAPGQTVGWGFTLMNNTPNYVIVDSSNYCGVGGNPIFTDCTTPYNPPTQFGPSYGTYTDYIASNTTVLAPGQTLTEDFDATTMTGVGAYMIYPTAPVGAMDTGNIFISYYTCSTNPFTVGCASSSGDMFLSAPASVTVTSTITVTGATQVNYVSHVDMADAALDFTNSSTDSLCVNVFAFAPDEELVSCCSCAVTPNGLDSLSVRNAILNNTLTSMPQSSLSLLLVGTTPGTGGTCNPATVSVGNVAPGLHAWASSVHALMSPSGPATGYQMTEREFRSAALMPDDLSQLATECFYTQLEGSGAGVCSGCQMGSRGAAKQ